MVNANKGLLISAAAGIGAAAALAGANAALAAATSPLWPVLPGEEKRYSWRDGEIGYAVRGDGPPMLLLHGIYATSCGFEMRRVFASFAETHRVFCPDLLGFGLSDRPAMDYTPATYMQLIRDFVQDVIGGQCVVVASSLTAAYVIQLAYDYPSLFSRLILSCPTGIKQLANTAPSKLKDGINGYITSPIFGEAAFNTLASKPSLRYFLENQSYYDKTVVTDEMVEYYYASAHQPNARYAPAAFVSQQLSWPAQHAFASLSQPVMVVWGANAAISPVSNADDFRRTNPAAWIEIFDQCGALPHDERAADFVRVVSGWLTLPDAQAKMQASATQQM